MKKVISYCRKSSDEQSLHSTDYQQDAIRKYCQFKEYEIIQTYIEDKSAKDFNRPEWKKMIKYLNSNKGIVSKIIFLRHDRFSRSFELSLSVIRQLGKLGVEIETVESNVEMNSPESLLTRNIMLTLPEIENIRIGTRSKEGSYKCRCKGGWAGKAILGYSNIRTLDKMPTMVLNEKSEFIKKSFEKMASGLYSADEIRRWLNSKDINITKNQFPNIIRNIAYTGKILVKAFGNNPEILVNGLHPALVTDELFAAANEVLNGRRRKMRFGDDKSDLYPLKGVLKCHNHNRSLSAYKSQSRNKSWYHYYICTKSHCRRYPIELAHSKIEEILCILRFSAQTVQSYSKVLESVFSNEDKERIREINATKSKLKVEQESKIHLQNEYIGRKIDAETFMELKQMNNAKIYRLETELTHLGESESTFKTYLRENVPMLEDILQFYRKSNGRTKNKILRCIFNDKVYFNDDGDVVYQFTPALSKLIEIADSLLKKGDKIMGLNIESLGSDVLSDKGLIDYSIEYRSSIL